MRPPPIATPRQASGLLGWPLKVTVSGVTGTMHNSTRITSNNIAQDYAVSWIDDRAGANNWHVYYRGYKYDSNGQPAAMGTDVKVDDGSAHVTQGMTMSGHPTQVNLPWYDSRVAWHDDRLNPGVNQHVYFNYVGSDAFDWQVAGVANIVSGSARHLQLAGVMNYAGDSMRGAQLSFVSNISPGLTRGLQFGLVNVGGSVEGE